MFQDYDGEYHNNYNQPVHEFLNCTVNDAMLLVYSYHLRHNLTWKALEDLTLLLNTVLGKKSLPTTKYAFKKKFELPPATIHLYCIDCQKYSGKKENFVEVEEVLCDVCEKMRSTKTKYNKNHFMTLSIENEIASTVNYAIKKNRFSWPRQANDKMSDVYDGEIYQNLYQHMNGRNFITLCVSTDGIVVQKSTKKKSLWPIQFIINEIHPKYRFKRENIICAAFWFGDTPNMSMFFKEFIEELNEINDRGGVEIQIGNRTERFSIVTLCVTMDSVAKCHVAAITQFNGHNSCPYCHHNGTIIAPAKNVKFCICDNARERNHEETKAAMIESFRTGRIVDGYRGISPILALNTPHDSVWIFGIDKMHSMDLGVDKRMFNIWFDPKNSNQP